MERGVGLGLGLGLGLGVGLGVGVGFSVRVSFRVSAGVSGRCRGRTPRHDKGVHCKLQYLNDKPVPDAHAHVRAAPFGPFLLPFLFW